MKSKSKYYYVFRSAVTGYYISKKEFEASPKGTVYRERRLR